MITKIKAIFKKLGDILFPTECYKESLGYTCRHRPGECGGPR